MNERYPWKKPENTFDAAVITTPLDTLVRSVENQIERRWPVTLGGPQGRQLPLVWMVKTARWTNHAFRYLLADKPPDPERKLEFSVAARPLNRTILDMVFNLVYMFDDYPRRLCEYFLHGIDQNQKQDERYVQRFSADPEWQEWLQKLRSTWPVREEIKKAWMQWCPDAKPIFPHPGKMVSHGFQKNWNNPESLEFLEYLNAQYYRELSSSAHGHWMGVVAMVVQPLRLESREDEQEEFALKEKSDLAIQQILFLMCLITELLTFAKLEGADRAAYLWTVLSGYSGWTKEIYEMRYQAKLVT